MYFKLNIDNINECVSSNKNYYKKLKEINNTVYQNVFNLREAWDDINTNQFISSVKNNAFNIEDYITNLSIDDEHLLEFTSAINDICKTFNVNKVSNIKFDDTYLSIILSYLDNVNNNMDNIIKNANRIINLDGDFNYNSYNIITKAKNIKTSVNSLYNDIKNFSSSINEAYTSFEKKYKKHEFALGISKIDIRIKNTSLIKGIPIELESKSIDGINLKDIMYDDK